MECDLEVSGGVGRKEPPVKDLARENRPRATAGGRRARVRRTGKHVGRLLATLGDRVRTHPNCLPVTAWDLSRHLISFSPARERTASLICGCAVDFPPKRDNDPISAEFLIIVLDKETSGFKNDVRLSLIPARTAAPYSGCSLGRLSCFLK